MSLHTEINLELEICRHLCAHGWIYAEGDAANYDRARAFYPADVLAWVQSAYPRAWETLTKNHGTHAAETLLARLRDQLDQRGTLDVLRHGVELLGLRQPLKLAEFKPALAMNPDILARYEANRLRVVRQVKYSLHNENCIDLVAGVVNLVRSGSGHWGSGQRRGHLLEDEECPRIQCDPNSCLTSASLCESIFLFFAAFAAFAAR